MVVCQRCKAELIAEAEVPLTQLGGSVESMVCEMKRRAGFTHDCQLASFLGNHQTVVPKWRARGNNPVSALLRFEKALSEARA